MKPWQATYPRVPLKPTPYTFSWPLHKAKTTKGFRVNSCVLSIHFFLTWLMQVWLASMRPLTLCAVSTYGDFRDNATCRQRTNTQNNTPEQPGGRQTPSSNKAAVGESRPDDISEVGQSLDAVGSQNYNKSTSTWQVTGVYGQHNHNTP